MYKLSWIQKISKIKSGFFLKRINLSVNQMISGDSHKKVSTTDNYGLAPLQDWERIVIDIILLGFP